ncbi:Regulator of rDNA transcription protein 15 [Capsicum baccatum]|uniref:Regulator of rDNA transcription protein 15 n=1 Tax=Capsicum baccatum TaxID=33114 RepID=A0A2G2V448_CAPBA|nr:Regulator of rDNA transcription protein 15 [Capsicum baccatum]
MIGRADIEGSKSNVAMNALLPQANYPCGNFSDTSRFEFRRSKGLLGHTFTVRIRTGNQNQTSFYPSVPHEISVLVELILGHLRYLLTDVPPQPNSPPDNVFRPDRPAERALGPKRGATPLVRTSSELAVRRAGKAPEGTVPSPSPGRHAATRSRRGSSSSSPPIADGFGTGTPVPIPQSQSFSKTYGSIFPTSLAYIVPSTIGCSPWRPDAVMSTTGCGRHSVLRIFKGLQERIGHHATCGALPAAGPYLWLNRFQGAQAVKQKRQLFLRLPSMSPEFLMFPSTATSRFRNFNPIPFRSSRKTRYLSGFPRPLGSTNPCSSVVHMEPFPYSLCDVVAGLAHATPASMRNATWLILPVVICLSQRLSHACAGRSAYGVHQSSRPFCRRCAPGLNWLGRASGAVTLKKLECSKLAYALYTLAWDNIIGFRSYYVGLRDRSND